MIGMNKKTIYKGLAVAGLGLLAACSNETGLDTGGAGGDAVCFAATLPTQKTVVSRAAFDDEKGETEVLPYVNAIHIRKIQASAAPATVTPYNVKTANKGVLEYQGAAEDALKWDKDHLGEPVDFFAWTTPSGVAIDREANEGSVDFVAGNTYNANPPEEKDRLNGKGVTPLEVWISALSTGNDYQVSPSVTLPFTHLASKVSLYVRNWDNQHIDAASAQGVSIEFFSLPERWKVAQATGGSGKAPFRVTQPAGGQDLRLDFTRLYYDAANGYFTFYLPPLTGELGTDFASAGDFCLTYGGSRFYGTLASIPAATLTELKAGQHMAIQLDLSKNYGVGVGAYIVKWKGPDKEDEIFANPNRGIYSAEGLRLMAEYLQSSDPAKQLPDSLFVTDGMGRTAVRLYNDLELTPELAAVLATTRLKGIVFDGQGHTITLPQGATTLFEAVGEASVATEVANLYLSAGSLAGRGMLANAAAHATISNCHALAGRVEPASGAAGGLIGTAGAGLMMQYCSSVASVTGAEVAGGLVGEIPAGVSGVSLDGCYAQSVVTAAGLAAGGLVGDMQAGSLTNSFFYADGLKGLLAGTASAKGALAGQAAAGVSISQCYWGNNPEGLAAVGGGTAPVLTACSAFETAGGWLLAPVTIGGQAYATLLDALRAAAGPNTQWVWVYEKDYPVIERK